MPKNSVERLQATGIFLFLSHIMRNTTLFILFLLLAAACGRVPSVEWTEGPAEPDGRALHTLVLHDVPEGSRVWFQELFDGKTSME